MYAKKKCSKWAWTSTRSSDKNCLNKNYILKQEFIYLIVFYRLNIFISLHKNIPILFCLIWLRPTIRVLTYGVAPHLKLVPGVKLEQWALKWRLQISFMKVQNHFFKSQNRESAFIIKDLTNVVPPPPPTTNRLN